MKKTGVILLAAGSGKRFGGNKLEALVGEKPMFIHALELIHSLSESCGAVVVTGNAHIAAESKTRGMNVACNREPERGISHSIKMGLQMLLEKYENVEAAAFMVCDQPWLSTETLHRLFQTYDQGIMTLEYEGKRGNPVIFSDKYFDELMNLTGDIGGRQVMEKHKEDISCLKVYNEKELWDIDRKDQLE